MYLNSFLPLKMLGIFLPNCITIYTAPFE